MIVTASLLLLSFSVIFLFNLLKPKNKSSGLPPGPKGLPLIGNLHQLDPVHPHVYFRELAKKYGPIMRIKFGFRTAVVISSARVAKLAFKNNDLALAGRPALVGLEKHSYDGNDITFSTYNETWRELRKLSVIHLFSAKQVASFYPIRRDEVSRMIKDMIKKSASSELINMSHATFLLVNRIICRVGFGKNYDDLEERRFDRVFKECQELAGAFYFGDHFPLLGWIDRLNGMRSRLDNNFRVLDDFYQGLVDEHLDPNRPDSMRGDILDLMIKLKQDEAAEFPIKWENIKGILMNVFVAGTDTSSSTLGWAMSLLIKNPQAMKKAQEEVRNVVGAKGTVEEDDIQHLPYLKTIIKETLRLFPPVPLSIPKETLDKCTIDGYEIPAKTTVYVNTHAIGLDPEYWENPAEFMPERFLNSTIDYKGHDYGLLPFGSGRRGCPGMNLGIATVELALASLLYSFDWGLPHGMKEEDVDMELSPGLATCRKNDLRLVGKCYEHIQ